MYGYIKSGFKAFWSSLVASGSTLEVLSSFN